MNNERRNQEWLSRCDHEPCVKEMHPTAVYDISRNQFMLRLHNMFATMMITNV